MVFGDSTGCLGTQVTRILRIWYAKLLFHHKKCDNAKNILGKNLPAVIGKTVQKKPERVEPNYVSILANLIAMDIMFSNQLAILVTYVQNIGLITTEYISWQTAKYIVKHIIRVGIQTTNTVSGQ